MSRLGFLASLIVSVLISSHTALAAKKTEATDACADALTAAMERFEAESAKAGSKLGLYEDQIIAGDQPSFAELIDPDPEKNLFARAPLTAMSAPQRLWAMILSQGVETRTIGFLQNPVTVYPFLTDGKEVTKGYRVEGNWQATMHVVSLLKAQAEGSRAGRTVPILFGPGGTGKSEWRTVTEKGAEHLTVHDPRFAVYTGEWIRMNELEEMVKRWGPDVDVIPMPRNKSPITILPPQLQQQALRMAAIKGRDMLDGIEPSVGLKPDKWSANILRYIIDHYSRKKGGELTLAETVQAVSRHFRVRRFVMSAGYNQFPVVNVQGVDSDATQLFVSSVPLVQAISPLGKMDPFAYSYSGLFFQGDGNVTVMEEITRSDSKFLEKFMDGLESRELQHAGAAKEPWDSFVIGISNKESYDQLMAKPGLSALKQRFQLIEMVMPVQPQLIARTLLYEFKDVLWMKPIGADDSKWVKADMDAVFPIPKVLAPGHVVGPERRYELRVGEGQRAVYISPHTLRFMAQIIAATRMETNKEAAYQLVQSRLIGDNLFTDPIQRIRFWEGRLTDVPPEERRTLDEMTNKLNEGHKGIVHRNGRNWLREALDYVRADSRLAQTLTPSVLLKVFEERGFRQDGFIQEEDHATATEYKRLARLVLNELLIPAVREDINFAYSAQKTKISDIYEQVLEELVQTAGKPNIESYTSERTGRVTTVNRERLNFVREHYRNNHGKELPLDQILYLRLNRAMNDGTQKLEPSPEIASALAAYLAKKTLELASAGLGEALRTGQGSKDTLDTVDTLVEHLRSIGYNRAAALDAFDLENLASQPSQTAK